MRLPRRAALLGLASLGAPRVALGAPPSGTDLSCHKQVLPGGLTLLVHEDHRLPLVAVNLWYHVGAADERAGRSGFAHLFEHLMFEGSRHVGRRFDELLEGAGATNVNGTTSWDRTNYFETVPREALDLALWIESDRMGFLLDTVTPERLEVQRGVVLNERRQNYEDAPYGSSALALYELLFGASHPYRGGAIGAPADIEGATLKDVHAFFHEHYTPANATLALVGDVTQADAERLVTKYFGSLPSRPRPARRVVPTPALTSPARREVRDAVDLGRVTRAWIAPPAFTSDEASLEVAASLLAGGKATRLHRRLVVERRLASEVSASVDANRLASWLDVTATAARGTDLAVLERELGEVVQGLITTPPSADELARARRKLLLGLSLDVQALDGGSGESGRAGWLQRFDHYLGDPGYLARWTAALAAVSADDVVRAIRDHARDAASATVITVPKPRESAP